MKVIVRLAGNRDCPGLPGMVEVTVTSALSNKYPTISLYEFNHITDLHQ